jgi:antirestriction protein ArdC
MKDNIYQRITNQVLDNLEQAGSWKKLWDVPQPVSLNGHRYSGINYLLLSSTGYPSPVWGTFKQVRANGGKVNQGEKSRLVVFWKRMVDKTVDPMTGKTEEVVKYLLRYYNVFNSGQCTFDDLGQKRIEELSSTSQGLSNERSATAEEIIKGMPDRPGIRLGSYDTPCYVPALDEVRMPELKYFFNSDAYYSAFFHELVHSTGHKKRLNRFEPDQFNGGASYSKEELVAELGAAYLTTVAGINPDMENTRAYIKGWLSVLKDNPTWVIWAASRAQKACELIVPSDVNAEVEEVQSS